MHPKQWSSFPPESLLSASLLDNHREHIYFVRVVKCMCLTSLGALKHGCSAYFVDWSNYLPDKIDWQHQNCPHKFVTQTPCILWQTEIVRILFHGASVDYSQLSVSLLVLHQTHSKTKSVRDTKCTRHTNTFPSIFAGSHTTAWFYIRQEENIWYNLRRA